MHEVFENGCEDDDEDDWFFDSVIKYKQLQMFALENVIAHVQASSPGTICLVQQHRCNRHEILELTLPEKLLSCPAKDCLTKNTDFKICNGGFVDSSLIQVKALYNQKRVVTSEGSAVVHVYQLGNEGSSLVARVGSVPVPVERAHLAVNVEGLVLASSTARDGVHLLDICAGRLVSSVRLGPTGDCIHPVFSSHNVGGVCFTDKGLVQLRDLRQNSTWTLLGKERMCSGLGNVQEQWTVASLYENCIHTDDVSGTMSDCQAKIALLSTKGRMLLYDMRNSACAVLNMCLPHKPTLAQSGGHKVDVRFSPGGALLSVSGFDANVYVYGISSVDCAVPVFTHEGHAKNKACRREVYVSSHMWLRSDIVISAGCDSSLHCWQF